MKTSLIKNTIFLFSLVLITSCGFTPLYQDGGLGNNSSVQANLSSIYIENIPNREGQILRNLLIDKFYTQGRPINQKHILRVEKIHEKIIDLDVTKSSDATRAQLKLVTKISLIDKTTDKELLTRKLHAITSYNILEGQFTTHVSEGNARKTALKDLARQIEQQIAIYLSR